MGATKEYLMDLYESVCEKIYEILKKYDYDFEKLDKNGDIFEDIMWSYSIGENSIFAIISFIDFIIINYEEKKLLVMKRELYKNINHLFNTIYKREGNNPNANSHYVAAEKIFSSNYISIDDKKINQYISNVLKNYGYKLENIKNNDFNIIFKIYLDKFSSYYLKSDLKLFIGYIVYIIMENIKNNIDIINSELFSEIDEIEKNFNINYNVNE